MFVPQEKSYRHYTSVGLVGSLMLVAIALTSPLGTTPNICHNAITPNDLYSSSACGFSGVLVGVGAMGVVTWSKQMRLEIASGAN